MGSIGSGGQLAAGSGQRGVEEAAHRASLVTTPHNVVLVISRLSQALADTYDN